MEKKKRSCHNFRFNVCHFMQSRRCTPIRKIIIKTITKEPNKANETWLNCFSKIIVRNPLNIITCLGSGLTSIYFLKNSYSLPNDVTGFCKKFMHAEATIYIAQETFIVATNQIYRSPLELKVPFSIYCVSTRDIYACLRNIGRLQEKLD